MELEMRPSDRTACLTATVALCGSGISQQGSANNGYLHLSLPHNPRIFFLPNISLWYKGVEGTHSKQYRRYSFILLGRRSPCQRSMARLARITVISNLQFLFSKQFVAGRSRLRPSEHYQSCNMNSGGGGGQGRKEGGERSFLRLLLSLKGLPMALIEMNFSGQSSVTSVWGGACHLA